MKKSQLKRLIEEIIEGIPGDYGDGEPSPIDNEIQSAYGIKLHLNDMGWEDIDEKGEVSTPSSFTLQKQVKLATLRLTLKPKKGKIYYSYLVGGINSAKDFLQFKARNGEIPVKPIEQETDMDFETTMAKALDKKSAEILQKVQSDPIFAEWMAKLKSYHKNPQVN